MKSLKDFLEARMIATGDFKISASGRKVRRLIKVGDDDYSKAKDLDNDGDNDADDDKARKMRGESLEEATVKKANYSWGKMVTVHHGADHSYPLHPEHQEAIKNLKHDEKTSFKDETGTKVTAHREGDNVHLTSNRTSKKTTVAHSHFTESYITEQEHFVHVSDGSKYDETPHPKDIEHVKTGAMHHGGKFDGHSDKGAYFKFKSREDAEHFKRHVDKCPHRTCHADVHESVEHIDEASVIKTKEDARLLQLARLGLIDKETIPLFRSAMLVLKSEKQLSIRQRNLLLSVYNSLVDLITGDDALFVRAKLDIQRDVKEEVEQIDEISKETLASYIPKAAKDARIHGQIATDFENRGKTARKPGSKDSWNRLSMKYKEKAWKRDDGISKAVTKLTKEETQSEGYYKDIDTNEKEDKRLGVWKKETPWRKIKSDTVTDKSGAVHTPVSKVRHLARLALKKTAGK